LKGSGKPENDWLAPTEEDTEAFLLNGRMEAAHDGDSSVTNLPSDVE
jgi:hypothetical protein